MPMNAPAEPITLSPTDSAQQAALAPQRLQQWADLTDTLTPLLHDPISCGDTIAQFEQCAGQLKRLVAEDPDIAIFLVVAEHADKIARYGVVHALHTATLVSLIARRKNWPAPRELSAIKAALSMNLSITRLQDELVLQTAPLTPEQRQQITMHPVASRKLLAQLGAADTDWLDAVAQHHEQADGRGYPYGAKDVHPLADAIHTADVFAAKLSPRINRSGMLSPRAAAEIFKHSSASYFGATLIRELGLYPPGCLVLLSSGETAMVLRRTADPLQPEVALLTTDEGQMLDTPHRCATGLAHQRSVKCAAAHPALVARFSSAQLFG